MARSLGNFGRTNYLMSSCRPNGTTRAAASDRSVSLLLLSFGSRDEDEDDRQTRPIPKVALGRRRA